jgi:hypothetical protein
MLCKPVGIAAAIVGRNYEVMRLPLVTLQVIVHLLLHMQHAAVINNFQKHNGLPSSV